MHKIIFISILITSLSKNAASQFNETIRTGRPGQAIGPFATGKRIIQIQTGFDTGGNDISSDDYHYKNLNTNFRYGITERFEINSAWSIQQETFDLSNSKSRGINISSVGFRIHLVKPTNTLPAIGIQLSLRTPLNTGDYSSTYFGLSSRLVLRKSTGKNSALLVNLAYSNPQNNNNHTFSHIINYGYNISEKWGIFIENYSNFTKNHFENYWDAGFSYLVNNNFQLDAYGGTSLNLLHPNFFFSIGFSGRIVSLRK